MYYTMIINRLLLLAYTTQNYLISKRNIFNIRHLRTMNYKPWNNHVWLNLSLSLSLRHDYGKCDAWRFNVL